MLWTVDTLDGRVDNELDALDATLKAKLIHVVQLLEQFGPQGVGLPHVKPLGNKLWEIRLKGKPGIARVIYITLSGRRIVLLHAFVKKGQKTPPQALSIALGRLQEISK